MLSVHCGLTFLLQFVRPGFPALNRDKRNYLFFTDIPCPVNDFPDGG
jgi:hypothetical protein